MAEGLLRHFAGDLLDIHSAGSEPAGYVHSKAIEVMKEINIDISAHTSKHLNEFLTENITTVITVCGNADQACPMFPGKPTKIHWPFDDPAKAEGTESSILEEFRRIRDEIRTVVSAYAQGLKDKE